MIAHTKWPLTTGLSWTKQYTSEPVYHDILRCDGTPYDAAEVDDSKHFPRPARGR